MDYFYTTVWGDYIIYSQYSDTFTSYQTCPKISTSILLPDDIAIWQTNAQNCITTSSEMALQTYLKMNLYIFKNYM